MKEAPQRFTLVEDTQEKKVDPAVAAITKKRRSHLAWACIGIFILFRMLNSCGEMVSDPQANSTGTFEPGTPRVQAQQWKAVDDSEKAFWIEFHKTFGGDSPTPTP